MIRVHLLTEPPTNQNTAAFLSPLVWNEPAIRARGIRLRIFYQPVAELTACDVVAVNGKFWAGDWNRHRDAALPLLERLRQGRRLLYFDRSSTPGMVNADALPYVDGYFKNAVYAERSHYLRAVYGARLFAEYSHDQGVQDAEAPPTQAPLSQHDAGRLAVSWNTGLANYSLLGPRRGSLYRWLPTRRAFVPPRRFVSPSARRVVAVSCRMGLRYRYATVGHQRQRMAEQLVHHRRTDRISKFAYMRELAASRVVASPFGYSEINYKDFETFLAGAALLKPDMSHLETWPNYYRPDDTYIRHSWDLADVPQRLEEALRDTERTVAIAQRGQDLHRWHVADRAGQEAFVQRFVSIVQGG